jgi:hypothetical protein
MFDAFDKGVRPEASHRREEEWGRLVRREMRSSDGAFRPDASAATGMAFRDVLRHVHTREAPCEGHGPADLRQLNQQLLRVLNACHEVDTARRRLMGGLNAQQILKDVGDLLNARGERAVRPSPERRRLVAMMQDLWCSVDMARALWDSAGRYFTRLTRLLPAQLDANGVGFVPVAPDEIDRLALEVQRLGEASARTPDGYCHSASDRFALARAAYLQAVTDWEQAQRRWARASRVRQQAEPGVHLGARGALVFAKAVSDQEWQRSNLLMREAHASMASHALYAVALQLPRHLGLS